LTDDIVIASVATVGAGGPAPFHISCRIIIPFSAVAKHPGTQRLQEAEMDEKGRFES
jgi:hypothetical protein